MKKERIVLIISLVIMSLSSIVSAMAVSAYLYNSNEVSYNNNASGITSTNVQGAIDELYEHATDYTSMNTRVSSLENRWESGSNTNLFIKNTGSGNRGVQLFDSSNTRRLFMYFDPSSNKSNLVSYNTSGVWGGGELHISGNPVKINAEEINKPTIIGNTLFIDSISTNDINTITINFPFVSYRNANGILFTRYGMHYINMRYITTSSSTFEVKATQLGYDSGHTETITASVSGTSAIFKSNNGWNRFSLILNVSDSPANLTFSYSKT